MTKYKGGASCQGKGDAGDTSAYMGHFRQGKNMKEGHNTVATSRVVSPDLMGRRAVRRALTGGTPEQAAAVGVERPVLLARLTARQNIKAQRAAGATRSDIKAARQVNRTNLVAARNDPNSARSERLARRGISKVTSY